MKESINNKNKKATNNVASMVTHILTDINNLNDENYINLSVHDSNAEGAAVASMVMRSSNKRGPHRHPSSILGCGASALFINFFGDYKK